MQKTKKFLLFFVMFNFLIMGFCFAQAADLIINTSNTSPKEGETVKLTLESDKYNLNNAKIIWYIDGNEEDAGVGRKTFSVTMQNQNPVQVISASVQEEGLEDSQAQIILEISGEILLYEGYNSQTPLFYKGRSLPAKEGSANVQLLSFKDGEITSFKPATFQRQNYIWKINGEEKNNLSGINKSQNILTGDVVDSNFSIQVLKQDENTVKNATLDFAFQNPEILLYRQSEDGLLKTLLKDEEVGKNLNIVIEPLFFTANNKYSTDLKYIWKINNLESTVTTPWYVAFSGVNKETVKINLNINNDKKITQKSTRAFVFRVE